MLPAMIEQGFKSNVNNKICPVKRSSGSSFLYFDHTNGLQV